MFHRDFVLRLFSGIIIIFFQFDWIQKSFSILQGSLEEIGKKKNLWNWWRPVFWSDSWSLRNLIPKGLFLLYFLPGNVLIILRYILSAYPFGALSYITCTTFSAHISTLSFGIRRYILSHLCTLLRWQGIIVGKHIYKADFQSQHVCRFKCL